MMLNAAAITAEAVRSRPFRWGVFEPTFADPAVAEALVSSYPDDGFEWSESRGDSDKTYRMANRYLVHPSGDRDPGVASLPNVWRRLVDYFVAPEYRTLIGEATGVDLREAQIEVRLCRYSTDCWIDPHTDRPDKLVTHVVYMNPEWRPEWGGCLRILRTPSADDVAHEVVPRVGTSVAFVRSDDSWHSVARVRPGVGSERRSVLIHLSRPS